MKLTSAEPPGLLGGLSIRRVEHGVGAGFAEGQRGLVLSSWRRDESRRFHFLFLAHLSKECVGRRPLLLCVFFLFEIISLSTKLLCGESSLRACCKWENASTALYLSLRFEEKEIRERRRAERGASPLWKRRGASTCFAAIDSGRSSTRSSPPLHADRSSLLASSSPPSRRPHLFSWFLSLLLTPYDRFNSIHIEKQKQEAKRAPERPSSREFFFRSNPLPSSRCFF